MPPLNGNAPPSPEGRPEPRLWRNLTELAEGGGPVANAPDLSAIPPADMGRRDFLKLVSAAVAASAAASCAGRPEGRIAPYTHSPGGMVPGQALYYATAMPHAGYGFGLLVKSLTGRPVKIEGNPSHPASLGAADAWAQASTFGLYDPERSREILHGSEVGVWEEFVWALQEALRAQEARRGAGLRIVTGATSSPTLLRQMGAALARFPEARWYVHEALADTGTREAARRAFGRDVDFVLHLDRAARIVSLDCDFLLIDPGRIPYARALARRRGAARAQDRNRLYVVESAPSLTGANADHRIPLPPSGIAPFARALASALGIMGAEETGAAGQPAAAAEATRAALAKAHAVARDLLDHRGESLVIAGIGQPVEVQLLAHAMNAALGAVGRTCDAIDPVRQWPGAGLESLAALTGEMEQGEVQCLLILGGNPVYDAPADVPFAEALARVPFTAHLGLHADETAYRCGWHVPEAHFLESWSDVRCFDGTAAIIQPLIAPIYGGRSAHELLALVGGDSAPSPYEIVRATWRDRMGADFEGAWERTLRDGVVAGSASHPVPVSLAPSLSFAPAAQEEGAGAPAQDGLEILFRPDPSTYDGRFAANAWLQELPRPVTKTTWDAAALLSPALASTRGLEDGDVVELTCRRRSIRLPVLRVPGHADGCISLALGGGRTRAGRTASGVGVNAGGLRVFDHPWSDTGASLSRTGERREVATTHAHHGMEGREPVRIGTGSRSPEVESRREDLYPAYPYRGYRWGMAIDLAACIGCNACVVACQSENNIPVVGRDQVLRGREMHWLRVDAYFRGDPAVPEVYFQPVPCMQCEEAPCEPVCPVGATSHSDEGLNDMVYNRCVGTRYCSNNCPYKVRRFNFYTFADYQDRALEPLWNPDVTVRSRGVMEKCTYCVQRITGARIAAEIQDRPVRDGEVLTACQATCPTGAITFGDLNDRGSAVSRTKASPRNYVLLEELNTRPRTSYLAALRNPNPEMEG